MDGDTSAKSPHSMSRCVSKVLARHSFWQELEPWVDDVWASWQIWAIDAPHSTRNEAMNDAIPSVRSDVRPKTSHD